MTTDAHHVLESDTSRLASKNAGVPTNALELIVESEDPTLGAGSPDQSLEHQQGALQISADATVRVTEMTATITRIIRQLRLV